MTLHMENPTTVQGALQSWCKPRNPSCAKEYTLSLCVERDGEDLMLTVSGELPDKILRQIERDLDQTDSMERIFQHYNDTRDAEERAASECESGHAARDEGKVR